MDAGFFQGFQGLDIVHLIAFGVIAVTVAVILLIAFRSPATATLLSLMSGKYFKMSNSNSNNGLAHSQSVERRLEKHEDECRIRHNRIDENFKELFTIGKENAEGIARIEGYLKAKSEVRP